MKSFENKLNKKLKLLWDICSELQILETPNTDDGWLQMEQLIEHEEIKEKYSPVKTRWGQNFQFKPRFVFAFATAFILLLISQPMYIWMTTESIVTKRGEQISFVLPDESHIKLNADSKLTFRSSFNEKSRLVSISGEAYFDVKPGLHPFIIQHEDVFIQVVGTKFNVRTIDEEIEVAVNEGIVLVSNEQTGDNSVHLTKGQLISFDKKESPGIPEFIKYDQYPGWIHKKFIFEQENLGVVCKEIERKFDVDIKLESDELESITVTGIIDAENLSNVLHTLSSLTNKPYKFDNKRYTFY